MMRWLHMRFRAPLVSFGGETIDSRGVIRRFPSRSMLTGLLANALGWERSMRLEHQALQDRTVFGALHEGEPPRGLLTDYQTARLTKDDKSWTSRGVPVGRAGASYTGSHQRWRDYHADASLTVVLRLVPEDPSPTLEEVRSALVKPARPLFIGRKPCLPSALIVGDREDDWVDADTAYEALCAAAPAGDGTLSGFWPESEGRAGAYHVYGITDDRNWVSGLHGGSRRVCEGPIPRRRGVECPAT